MARNLQARRTRHRETILPTVEQGLARPSGFIAIEKTLPAVLASVESDGVVDTEVIAPAQPATGEAAAQARSPTVGLLTKNDAVIFVVDQTQFQPRQVLQGRIEKSSGTKIEGWAWDPQAPDRRIPLELVEDDNRLSLFIAYRYRYDLVQLGCGDGRHGFGTELEEGRLSEGSHLLILRCADTRATMPGSPIVAERRMPAAPSPASSRVSETARIIRGQLDNVADTGILGWVMMPNRPLHRCTVLLKAREHILAQTTASLFRMDLLSAGVGDGCYSFVFEPPWPLADGQEHMLDIVEEQTGAKLNKEPVRWFSELGAGRTQKARPSGASDNRLWSALPRLEAGGRLGHAISLGDYARFRQWDVLQQ